MRRTLALVAAILLAVSLYGFFHEKLYTEQLWSPVGASRFLTFAAVYGAWAGVFLWLRPRWFPAATAVAVLAYTIWWAGAAAPLAVLYFLGSALLLGKLVYREADHLSAALLGTALWMFAIWVLLHFAVNVTALYVTLFAVPYLIYGSRIGEVWPRTTARDRTRGEIAALALLVFLLLAHWLVALKPDVSSDGLSMHLALPAMVADQHHWAFDFKTYTWAVMPASVDGLYAALYLLGGEAAARLLNFSYLVLIGVGIVQGARRWTSLSQALLAAALFVSTPMVQLVTGSLFVENVWGALVLGAVLLVLRFLEEPANGKLLALAILSGAAVSCKLIAAAYVAPVLLVAAWQARSRPFWRALALPGSLFAVLAAIPYAYAWVETGNPIFPFANARFRSPDFPSQTSFDDVRYHAKLSWKTPYDMTFRSTNYLEGQGGAGGFQWLLLLLPAALAIRRRDQAVVAAVAILPTAAVLLTVPNLRYLYPVLPLFSLAIAWLPAGSATAALLIAIAGFNLWFLPSASWYDHDFALFRKSDVVPYLAGFAPARALIDHLNRNYPGEAAAFFGTDAIANLRGTAYSDNWHSETYWGRVRAADAPGIAEILRGMGIRHVVAPLSRESAFPGVREFLKLWVDADGPVSGTLGVFRVRDSALPVVKDHRPLVSGSWEDTDTRLDFTGKWINDRQFAQATASSVTYTDASGQTLGFTFEGSRIKYVFTRAANRGIAEVLIDGKVVALVDAYSAQTEWQAAREFAVRGSGPHTFAIRATGRKSAGSAGTYVDVDRIDVAP